MSEWIDSAASRAVWPVDSVHERASVSPIVKKVMSPSASYTARTTLALAAGTRAEDLALRLKYAGFGDDVAVERGTAAALERGIDATPAGGRLYVVPTYTAMLEAREWLAKRSGASKFWEQR